MRDLHALDKYRDRDFERQYYGTNGDAGNGVFRVPVGGKMFKLWHRMAAAGNMFRCPQPTRQIGLCESPSPVPPPVAAYGDAHAEAAENFCVMEGKI